MATNEAFITPSVLEWAINRAGFSVESIHKKADKWIKGEARPTFNQAMDIAKKLQIPFGYLWLKEPPVEQEIIPDLRTIDNLDNPEMSLELRTTIKDAAIKQEWYKDYITSNDYHMHKVVGNFSMNDEKKTIVEDIQTKFELSDLIGNRTDKDIMLKTLIEKAETLGILVMQSSIFRNNTQNPLNIREFRGFAIYDDVAPLIFINSKDAKAAQIFTFFHEIAHLWINQEGVSDPSIFTPKHQVELFCNEIAAMVLMPKDKLEKEVFNIGYSSHDQLVELANIFSVSTFAILNRLRGLGLIEANQYFQLYENEKRIFENTPKTSTKGAPPYERLVRLRNGALFTSALVVAVMEGKETYTQGMRLLGVKNTDILEKVGVELKIISDGNKYAHNRH